MGGLCACHCDGVIVVLEAVVGLVLDGGVGWLLGHAGFETAALDHEAGDDTMEYRIVVVTFVDIGQKILDGFGRFGRIEFEGNDAKFGNVKFDFGVAHRGSLLRQKGVRAGYLISVARVMTTAVLGTSLGKGPPGPVGVTLILLMMSMPLTTFPKTVYPHS